jgi:hypothetical protein
MAVNWRVTPAYFPANRQVLAEKVQSPEKRLETRRKPRCRKWLTDRVLRAINRRKPFPVNYLHRLQETAVF